MSFGGARKITGRRRVNQKSDLNAIKQINFGSSQKDIVLLIKEQLIGDDQLGWRGSELLFVVPVVKKKKVVSADTLQNPTSTASSASRSSNEHERYLVFLKRVEKKEAYMLRLSRKENELQVKMTFNMKELKSIDFTGNDDLELAFSFESTDVLFLFVNQVDRDECLWISSQITKVVCGEEVYIGYSVDLDSITFLMVTSTASTRFPPLQKILRESSAQIGDQFTQDELEAEHILDELQWGNSSQGIGDIHQLLAEKNTVINEEIIDFLLQWEEMDETMNSMASSSTSSAAATPSGRVKLSLSTGDFGLKDTGEVLRALASVDGELAIVDKWLGMQIDRLSEVQANLSQIEDESGALESSWQSLTIVEKVLQLLLEKYTLNSGDEELLRAPDKALSAVMKASSLNNVSQQVKPLQLALSRLRDALVTRLIDQHGLSTIEWKQIQAISSIRSQREKLSDLSETFTLKFSSIALGIFDWLLKHKSLVDGDATGQAVILPRSFAIRSLLEELTFSKAVSSFAYDPIYLQRYRVGNNNLLLEAQALFHRNLSHFVPLLDLLVELAPNYARPLRDAYVRAVQERLYFPLLKAFLKEVQSHVNQRPAPITLANCERFTVTMEPILRFDQTKNKAGQTKNVTAWKALQASFMLIAPVIEREESFIKTIFKLDGRSTLLVDETLQSASPSDDVSSFVNSKLHDMVEGVFDGLLPRFLKLSSSKITSSSASASAAAASVGGAGASSGSSNSNVDHDGVEAAAMLTMIKEFSRVYSSNGPTNPSSSTNSSTNIILESAISSTPSSFYLDKLLTTLSSTYEVIISQYCSEQVTWITAQKADPKAAGVLPPFFKFPTLVQQVLEMTNELSFAGSVSDMLPKLARELFAWLNSFARQHEKYTDKIKITNLSFFRLALGRWNLVSLQSFLASATQQVDECTARYIHWMVAYEFPSLSVLAARMDGVGNRVADEELSVYVRRKDVLGVINEMQHKTIETVVTNLRKRLEKHFKSDFDNELRLVQSMWTRLKDRMVSILTKLETAATVSYQIQLEINPRKVVELFDKYLTS